MTIARIRWPLLLAIGALAAAGVFALTSTRDAESAGPFVLNGVAESVITIDLGTQATTHANCRFRMSTDGSNVATLRGTCYTIAKASPGGGTPLPPPPPPPPYINPASPLTGGGGLTVLSGSINQGDGSVTLQFSPALCLPVDTSVDMDTIPDAGLLVNLDTSGSKSGAIGNGTVQLDFDTGQQGADPIVCAVVDETDTAAFNPTNLPANHDEDIWGNPALGQVAADGCTTSQELGTAPGTGGMHDPFNYWDLYSVPTGMPPVRNDSVSGPDINAVIPRFGATGSPTGDPTVGPFPAAPAYHTAYDRGAAIPGANSWSRQGPNGSISAADINAAIAQFGHNCA